MQKFNIAASETKTLAELVANFRTDVKHEIANNLLIESSSLEFCPDQGYHHSDERPLHILYGKIVGIHSPTYDRSKDLPQESQARIFRCCYSDSLCSDIRTSEKLADR